MGAWIGGCEIGSNYIIALEISREGADLYGESLYGNCRQAGSCY